EVWQVTGRPISAWQTQWSVVRGPWSVAEQRGGTDYGPRTTDHEPTTTDRVLWLDLPRADLYAGINARVERMFAAGLVEEVRALRALGRPLSREASQALGYKEVIALLDGKASLAETVARVQTRTRHFAKRQIAWFRHLPECRPATRELTRALWAPTING